MLLHATRKQLATFCCQVSKTHTTEFVLTAAVLTSKILAAANFTSTAAFPTFPTKYRFVFYRV